MRKQVFEANPQYISQKTTKKWHQSQGVAHKFCPNWSKIQVFDKKIAKILRFCLRNAVLFFAFCEKLKIFQKSGKWRNFSEIALESVLSKKTRFWSKSPVQIAKNYKKKWHQSQGVAHKFWPNWAKIQVFDKKIAKILRFCLRNAVLFLRFVKN